MHPDNDWEEQYRSGEIDFKWKVSKTDETGKPLFYQMEDGPKHTFKTDFAGMKKHEERIHRGLVLFGKYYRGLWD